jgi:hypothetical protein
MSLTAPGEVRAAARKEGSASTAHAAFCVRPAMQASADESYSLVLLVQRGSQVSDRAPSATTG